MKDSQNTYQHILSIFNARLEMKHLLKGTSYRKFTYKELREIFMKEVEEFDIEMDKDESVFSHTKAIEEALDVMISALLIADRIIESYWKVDIEEVF